MVVQNEPWGLIDHRQEAVEDLLSGLVMVPELDRSRPAFAAENDGGRLGLHSLVPSKDNPTSGHQERLIAARRFPLPKQDGAVVKRAEGGFAVRSAQGVESEGRLPVLKSRAKNDLLPRMNVGLGRGLGFVALADQDGGGLLSKGRLEFGHDGFKIVGIASIALGQKIGFVLAVQISLDQVTCDLHFISRTKGVFDAMTVPQLITAVLTRRPRPAALCFFAVPLGFLRLVQRFIRSRSRFVEFGTIRNCADGSAEISNRRRHVVPSGQ